MKLATLLLFAVASVVSAESPKIAVVHTSKEVCAYMQTIFAMPCRQAVLVAAESVDAASEGFKLTLTYLDSSGQEKTLAQMVGATAFSNGAKASATFYLDNVTVISATGAVVTPGSEVGKYPR